MMIFKATRLFVWDRRNRQNIQYYHSQIFPFVQDNKPWSTLDHQLYTYFCTILLLFWQWRSLRGESLSDQCFMMHQKFATVTSIISDHHTQQVIPRQNTEQKWLFLPFTFLQCVSVFKTLGLFSCLTVLLSATQKPAHSKKTLTQCKQLSIFTRFPKWPCRQWDKAKHSDKSRPQTPQIFCILPVTLLDNSGDVLAKLRRRHFSPPCPSMAQTSFWRSGHSTCSLYNTTPPQPVHHFPLVACCLTSACG